MTDYTPDQQSAFDYMDNLLNQYDLSALAGDLKNLILTGVTDSNELTLALQGTDAWKQRFAGNEMLKKAGVPVLSVAEYLSTEQSYAQVMKNYGLPKGFYDDHTDFANFIGNNVSANELQQRVSMYADVAKREDPSITAQLASMGMSQGDLLAYVMDPTRAEPIIQQKYSTALLGGAARRNGLVADNILKDLRHSDAPRCMIPRQPRVVSDRGTTRWVRNTVKSCPGMDAWATRNWNRWYASWLLHHPDFRRLRAIRRRRQSASSGSGRTRRRETLAAARETRRARCPRCRPSGDGRDASPDTPAHARCGPR